MCLSGWLTTSQSRPGVRVGGCHAPPGFRARARAQTDSGTTFRPTPFGLPRRPAISLDSIICVGGLFFGYAFPTYQVPPCLPGLRPAEPNRPGPASHARSTKRRSADSRTRPGTLPSRINVHPPAPGSEIDTRLPPARALPVGCQAGTRRGGPERTEEGDCRG